jgi:hypothetical protein
LYQILCGAARIKRRLAEGGIPFWIGFIVRPVAVQARILQDIFPICVIVEVFGKLSWQLVMSFMIVTSVA